MLNTTVSVDGEKDTLTETNIDLTAALGGRYGHAIVIVDTPPSLLELIFPNSYWPTMPEPGCRSRNIGLDAFVDQSRHGGLGQRRSRTAHRWPELSIWSAAAKRRTATTDADGMAALRPPQRSAASYLVARQGR